MTFDANLSVTEGLDYLALRLDPIIAASFPTDLGGHPWTVVLSQLDQIAGRPPRAYSTADLQAQLKMLSRPSLAVPSRLSKFHHDERLLGPGGEIHRSADGWDVVGLAGVPFRH
jgi:hypothetical protein